MNILKAPDLIISPKQKVYGGGGGALNDESTYTHTYTVSLSPPPPLSLPHPPYTNTSITMFGREGYWDGTYKS